MVQKYQLIINDLKRDILTGIYREGELLPSENELCLRYQVTRSTIRKALDTLVNEGYIFKHKGKGSIIHVRRNSLGLLSFKGFSDVLGKSRMKIRTLILQDPIIITWPRNFFFQLNEQEKEAGTIFLNRIRFVEEEPVMLEYTYLPNIDLPGFLDSPLVKDSLFTTLRRRYQVEVISLIQDIRAISADENTSSLLKIYPQAPILHIYRKYETSRPGLSIYSSLYCNTTKYFISNQFE